MMVEGAGIEPATSCVQTGALPTELTPPTVSPSPVIEFSFQLGLRISRELHHKAIPPRASTARSHTA